MSIIFTMNYTIPPEAIRIFSHIKPGLPIRMVNHHLGVVQPREAPNLGFSEIFCFMYLQKFKLNPGSYYLPTANVAVLYKGVKIEKFRGATSDDELLVFACLLLR